MCSADTYSSTVDIRTSESSDAVHMEAWDECTHLTMYGSEEYTVGLCGITRPARSVAIMAAKTTFLSFCEIQIIGHLVGGTAR